MDPAYGFEGELKSVLTIGGKSTAHTFKQHDQFGAQLLYFSACILEGRDPEPSGLEGLADLRIMKAIRRSIVEGRAVAIDPVKVGARPGIDQEIDLKPPRKPKLVDSASPEGGS